MTNPHDNGSPTAFQHLAECECERSQRSPFEATAEIRSQSTDPHLIVEIWRGVHQKSRIRGMTHALVESCGRREISKYTQGVARMIALDSQ